MTGDRLSGYLNANTAPRVQKNGRQPKMGAARGIAYRRLPAADCLLQTAYCRLQTSRSYAACSSGSGSRILATFRSLTTPMAFSILRVIHEMSNSYQARP